MRTSPFVSAAASLVLEKDTHGVSGHAVVAFDRSGIYKLLIPAREQRSQFLAFLLREFIWLAYGCLSGNAPGKDKDQAAGTWIPYLPAQRRSDYCRCHQERATGSGSIEAHQDADDFGYLHSPK